MQNELEKLGPITSAASQLLSGNSIKTPARDPLQASPTRDVSSPSGLPAGWKPTAAATGPVDAHGNDMTATNKMKAQLGEAPVGQVPASAPAPAEQAPAAPVVRDQHGNDMTATNAMKKQLGEAPITSPAASVPGLPAREAVQTRGYVATQSGQMNPSMERVINAQPNPILASMLNGKQTTVPQITGALPVQNVGPATPGQPAGPKANPLTSIKLQANNDSLARANAIRQQMIDGDGEGPKVTMLENSGLKETQALMDKWGRQDMQREMLQEMSRNPRAANAIAGLAANANNTEAQLRGQDIEASTAEQNALSRLAGQGVAAETEKRGQDLRAASEAAKLAGNPLTNALVQAQTETERLAGDKTRHQNDVLSQLARETDPAKRDTLIENALVAQGKAPQQGERLTLPERRGNLEIDAARKAVAGMTPEEIRRKTAKQTDTGRENPDFDPALERAVSLAARRKIGDDPVFDQRHAQPAQSSTQPAGDVSSRFSADPAMKSHRLGKQTELGTEVFDASGKLIGHYR